MRGIVQGVGFRPFVYTLAGHHGLTGSVWNDAEGVQIQVEGEPAALDAFLRDLGRPPPLARIETLTWQRIEPRGDTAFCIEESRATGQCQALVAPDVATCAECLAELFDPCDRRYRYPFINCTNCGPRFTITRAVPYDRASTTMAVFPMCAACRREYEDPSHRRFHAQPNACPECGPSVRLTDASGNSIDLGSRDAITVAADLLKAGAVLALKGLGGYHLACDPGHGRVVASLRGRKVRQGKPFALMARDLEQVRSLCLVTAEEAELLAAPERPIVLLRRREDSTIPIDPQVAPRQKTLGVMLAYTPLHHLLLADAGIPLVMTSGNRSDEPIAYRDEDASEQLGGIADYVLTHNRPIHIRCDDSVERHAAGDPFPIRRSRGRAPAPLQLDFTFRQPTLACGGELKNTFCLGRGNTAILSHHIGDLENYETLRSYIEGVEHFSRVFDVTPELAVYDLHPEYLSTKYAHDLEEDGLPAIGVQHHHAHIGSCLADNRRPTSEEVIGVALDGTGYGTDGAIWGGEFFQGSTDRGFVRRAHLGYIPLPGGAAAIREPWRMAVAHLLSVMPEEILLSLPLPFVGTVGEEKVRAVSQMIRGGVNAPPTSSAGRLFDAVGALLGVEGSIRTGYEGQAAVELELIARASGTRPYPFSFKPDGDNWVIETADLMGAIAAELADRRDPGEIAGNFHRTIAEMIVTGCRIIRGAGGPSSVALSGGTFQNMLLLEQTVPALVGSGFSVYLHRRVPTNDGGLSLGQAVLGSQMYHSTGG